MATDIEGGVRGYVRHLLEDGLFRDTSVLVVAVVLSGGINYLYQVAMGRVLGPEQFGVLGSLLGLFHLLSVLSLGVAYIATKYVSTLEERRRSRFLSGFTRRVGAFAAVMFLALIVLSPAIAAFLKVDEPVLVVLVGASFVLSLLLELDRGALRGLQSFVVMGTIDVVRALVRLFAGLALVWFGFSVFGALSAVAVAAGVGLVGAAGYLRPYYSSNGGGTFRQFTGVHRYAIPSILVGFCFTIPTSGDVLIVKHLFTPTEAGLYAAVAVFGKVLVFLPTAIASALFPRVSGRNDDGTGTRPLLRRALVLTGVLMGCAVGFLAIFSTPLLGLLFGSAYVEAAFLLPWYAAAIGVFSLSFVVLNYAHARGDRYYVRFFAIVTILELIVLFTLANSLLLAVQILLVGNLVALSAGIAAYRPFRSSA